MMPTPASLALGIYGLFGYHALYFAALKLAPPAEAHLLNSLWALFIVLFAALLPGHRLQMNHVLGALLGLAAAALLVWSRIGGEEVATLEPARLRLCARLRAGVVELFRGVAPAGRRAQRKPCGRPAWRPRRWPACAAFCSRPGRRRPVATAWLALAALGAGPVGAAFLLWDIGMKQGDTSLLGVLAYASPVISTGLLVALGLAEPTWALAVACVLMVAAAVIATRKR